MREEFKPKKEELLRKAWKKEWVDMDKAIGEDVCRNTPEGASECIWSFDESGETESDEPWDGFNSDAEADADALASAGFGTDEDYGCYDDYNDGW